MEGSGSKSSVTTHGLRGTLATFLLEAGQSDSSVSMRTDPRYFKSLKSYQHLRRGGGREHQWDIVTTYISSTTVCDA